MSTQKRIGLLTALAVLAAAFAIPASWNGSAHAAPTVALPLYDISVKKTHVQAGAYGVSVQNTGGSTIPVGWKIEITEIVPAGLVVTSTGGPWTCIPQPSGPLPVVGPDYFVCSYIVPFPGLVVSGFAPALAIFIAPPKGEHPCPNCVRVRLYSPPSHSMPQWNLVTETNTNNNVSCVP